MRGSFLGLFLFRLVTIPLQPKMVGPYPDTECMFSQPFVAGGKLTQHYPTSSFELK
jgi:hypothetical protein